VAPGEPPFGGRSPRGVPVVFQPGSWSRRQRTCCQLAIGSPFFSESFRSRQAARRRDGSGIRRTTTGFASALLPKSASRTRWRAEIRHRPRGDDGDAPPDVLAIEGPVRFFGATGLRARQASSRSRRAAGRDHPLGLVPPRRVRHKASRTDRETQNLTPKSRAISSGRTRGTRSARQRDDESQDGDGEIHAAWAFSRGRLVCPYPALASAARTSSSVARGLAGRPASVSSMTAVIGGTATGLRETRPPRPRWPR